MMRLRVLQGKCAGHARCAAVAPGIFTLDDEGYLAMTEQRIVPDDEVLARRGVRACPERAISVVDE